MKITSHHLAEQRASIQFHAFACLTCLIASSITHYTMGFLGLIFLTIALVKTPRHLRDLRSYLAQ